MHPAAPSGDGVGPFLDARVKTLFRHIAPAMNGDEESIHQMRVAARRLRVTLSLAALKPDGRKVRSARRLLKTLTCTAGSSRDLDVCVALFDEHATGGTEPSREAELLGRRLRQGRGRARRRTSEALLDLEIPTLRRRLRQIVARGVADLVPVLLRVRERRDTDGIRLSEEIVRLGRRFDPDALHGIRGRARSMRYVAEISAEFVERSRQAPRRLKVLQQLLGKMHDAWVLAGWLDGQENRCRRRGHLQEASEARRLAARFRRMSRSWHADYLDSDPGTLARDALAAIGRSESVA